MFGLGRLLGCNNNADQDVVDHYPPQHQRRDAFNVPDLHNHTPHTHQCGIVGDLYRFTDTQGHEAANQLDEQVARMHRRLRRLRHDLPTVREETRENVTAVLRQLSAIMVYPQPLDERLRNNVTDLLGLCQNILDGIDPNTATPARPQTQRQQRVTPATKQQLSQAHNTVIFTQRQSTHNPVIQESSRRTARNLIRVMPNVDVKQTLRDLKAFINQQPANSHEVQASKRFLSEKRHFKYLDERSNISVQRFLACAYAAFGRPELCHEGAADRKAETFLRMMYDCQRGDNLDVCGKDDGEADDRICGGGTFNKIAELLVGRLKIAEQVVRTPETFSLKFTATVREAFYTYAGYNGNLTGMLDEDNNLTDHGWTRLKPAVSDTMKTEYGTQTICGKSFNRMFAECGAGIQCMQLFKK